MADPKLPIAPGIPLVILPLGDSITAGFMWGTAPENSYRKPLLHLLTSPSHGNKPPHEVLYVGTRADGDFDNNAHDGWSGNSIHEIFSNCGILSNPDEYDGRKLPNIVLLHIGTNDCNDGEQGEAPARLEKLIDEIFERLGDEFVLVVAKITQSGWPDPCARIDEFNRVVPGIVGERRGRGRRCLLADMRDIGRGQDTIDGLHPNEIGFDKMAEVWVEAIREAEGLGWIQRLSSWKGEE